MAVGVNGAHKDGPQGGQQSEKKMALPASEKSRFRLRLGRDKGMVSIHVKSPCIVSSSSSADSTPTDAEVGGPADPRRGEFCVEPLDT